MRHRSVASIVCSWALILTLSACSSAHLSQSSAENGTGGGSMAPVAPPVLQEHTFAATDSPQSLSAPAVSPEVVFGLYSEFKAALGANKASAWGYVIDAHTGDVLLNEAGESAHVPASTTKILTAVAAHYHLDENATLSTGTSIDGENLYLWGEGDLLVGVGPSNGDVNGRASLATLADATADALKADNVTSVTLFWARQPFDGPSRLDTWVAQNVDGSEGHVAAYAIDSGLISATDSFSPTPEVVVADEFAALLRERGVSVVAGTAQDRSSAAREIARVRSAPLGEQIRFMMAHSDNTLADQLCRLSAQKAGKESSYSGSAQMITEVVRALGLSTEGLFLEDCSGLSSGNRIPPKLLADVLYRTAIADRADLRDVQRDLPWAAAQGTMSRRTFDGTAVGNVQGKTGSLMRVSTLAGSVRTSTGRELIYAVGVEDTDEGAAYFMRPHIDAFIQSLTEL